MSIETNLLYWGDNLPILREFPKECIDLIYLDPPFNSKRSYNVIFKDDAGVASPAQIKAFTDTWKWHMAVDAYEEVISKGGAMAKVLGAIFDAIGKNDVMAYLSMMALRISELQRVLSKDGSIFLHCDPTASHYLKLLLDASFDKTNYRNEIIWHYRKWPSGKAQFQRNHDVIFFYSKSDSKERIFKAHLMERTESTLKRFGNKKIISGYDEAGKRKPSEMSQEESSGVWGDDVWEIGRVPPIKQRYPTQKPPLLLSRIIESASNPNDIVLDPFAGCGTTIVEAHRLNRRWIGIDITYWAIHTIMDYMMDEFGSIAIPVRGKPTTLDEAIKLAEINTSQFEQWAVGLIWAVPTGGKPVDGEINFVDDEKMHKKRCIVEVTSGHPNKKHFDAFLKHVAGAEMGVYVVLYSPSKGMIADAKQCGKYHSEGWDKDFPKVQIAEIKELLEGNMPLLPPAYKKQGRGVAFNR